MKMLYDFFQQEFSLEMTSESIFPYFKMNDKISLCEKFSNFLKPNIFCNTQIPNHTYKGGSTAKDGEKPKYFLSLGNLVNCKHYPGGGGTHDIFGQDVPL